MAVQTLCARLRHPRSAVPRMVSCGPPSSYVQASGARAREGHKQWAFAWFSCLQQSVGGQKCLYPVAVGQSALPCAHTRCSRLLFMCLMPRINVLLFLRAGSGPGRPRPPVMPTQAPTSRQGTPQRLAAGGSPSWTASSEQLASPHCQVCWPSLRGAVSPIATLSECSCA